MKLTYGGSENINDYVLAVKHETVGDRNRDRSLIIPEAKIIVSQLFGAPVVGTAVEIYIINDSYPSLVGEVISYELNEDDNTYEFLVQDDLRKLQDYSVDYATLHTALVNGTSNLDEYIASDNEGYPSLNCCYLVKIMFQIAGLTMRYDVVSGSTPYGSFGQQILETLDDQNMRVRHLKMDENMLYAINQEYAINTTIIESDPEYQSKKISFFDFISEFFTHTEGRIYLSEDGDAGEYIIKHVATDEITLTDDVILGKDLQVIDGTQKAGYRVVNPFYYNEELADDQVTRYAYTTATLDELNTVQNTQGNFPYLNGDFYTLNNWVYMYQNWYYGSAGDVYSIQKVSGVRRWPNDCYQALEFMEKQISAVIDKYIENTFLTTIQTTRPAGAKSVEADFNNNTMRIIEEFKFDPFGLDDV